MATFNPVDFQYSVIKETTPGTLPGAGSLLPLAVDSQATLPNVEADTIVSPVSRPSRSIEAARRVNYRDQGSFALHLMQDAGLELLISSVLSNVWTAGVIKGSNVDQPFSVEERIATAAQYRRFFGNYGTALNLNVNFNGNAELGIEFMGMSGVTATTATALSYGTVGTTQKQTGLDVGTLTIGALSMVYKSAQLVVSQPREVQGRFGTASAYGIGASGPRDVRLTVTGYHEDLSAYTAFLASDTPVAATLTIGGAGNGFTFLLPRAVPGVPKGAKDPSAFLMQMELVGTYDNTEATDIKITKL